MKKYLTIVTHGGLCNRLNCILSCVDYKMHNPEISMRVLWPKTFDCYCHYSDLFEPLPSETGIVVENINFGSIYYPASKYNLYFPLIIRRFLFDKCIEKGCEPRCFAQLVKDKCNIYIGSANEFCDVISNHDLGKLFVPIKEIRDKVDRILPEDVRKELIGMHIRRTDNIYSIKGSPINHFHEIIKNNPDKIFYIASDDKNVISDFANMYEKRIINSNLELKRNSLVGMKDAVVDLFCLSKTQMIYGSISSTYSECAAKLSGIPLVL